MMITRINSMEFDTEKGLNKRIKNYKETAREQFPEAELLLVVQTSPTSVITLSTYSTREAADAADAARKKRKASLKKASVWDMEGDLTFFDLKDENSVKVLSSLNP